MALDESTDGLENLEANGISAYIDPKLHVELKKIGDINIDYVVQPGGAGYTIRAGEPSDCGGCTSC